MGPGEPRMVRPGTGGGRRVPQPAWICRLGVWRQVKWMRRRWRRWRHVVRPQWLLGGLSRLGVGLGGPFSVDVVAGWILLLVGGGGPWW